MGGEFTDESNLTRGERNNWSRMYYGHFRMWLLYLFSRRWFHLGIKVLGKNLNMLLSEK